MDPLKVYIYPLRPEPPSHPQCVQILVSILVAAYAEGNGNPLQYSCLKNPMDRGAGQATVQRVAEYQTRLSY